MGYDGYVPTVEIFGSLYKIRGEHSAERIRVLARYVDERMKQVDERANTGDVRGVAVLTALNIADDYYQTRMTLERREGEIADQARALAEKLNHALDASNDAVGSDELPGT
ncbi:MAG: cell division protein ZapA [Acidobacteriota bacterium]